MVRKIAARAIPMTGMALVVGAALMVPDGRLVTRVVLVVVGLLIVEAGVWNLVDPLLPDGRRYNPLRAEGDRVIGLIRELNRATLAVQGAAAEPPAPAAQQELAAVLARLQESMSRMVEVAGRTEAELADERAARVLDRRQE